jgi:hypothetical protein
MKFERSIPSRDFVIRGSELHVRFDEGFRMPVDELHFLRLGPSPGVRKSLKEEPAGNGR